MEVASRESNPGLSYSNQMHQRLHNSQAPSQWPTPPNPLRAMAYSTLGRAETAEFNTKSNENAPITYTANS
jgi:hypothetical protein